MKQAHESAKLQGRLIENRNERLEVTKYSLNRFIYCDYENDTTVKMNDIVSYDMG